ncbi:NACHT domain-containing protein [Brevundimonas vesicularis]|uniref:NACHT domain-containing protein n=1 Tax=Brevundimonas vesicularis TaxID=41276 RepID=UPI00384B4D07
MPASPELTGGAGFTFEDTVVAYYLASLLGEHTARGTGAATVKEVRVQRGALGEPLDDVIVESEDGGEGSTLSIQVKRSFIFADRESNAVFQDVVARILETIAKASFRHGRDRVGIATDEVDLGAYRHIRTLCDWARDSATARDFHVRVAKPGFAAETKRALVAAIRSALARASGAPAGDEEVFQVFRHLVVMRFELLGEGAADADLVLDRIRGVLRTDAVGDGGDVWTGLRVIAREAAGEAGSFVRSNLVERVGRGDRFTPGRFWAAELDHVRAEARLALSTIRRTVDGVTLDRDDLVDEINRRLQADRVVQIVGAPGSGKSALLARYATMAADRGSVLALRADRLSPGGWPAYARALGLTGVDPRPILREIAAAGDCVLVIDAIDRVRREDRQIVQEVLDAVLTEPTLRTWRVLVTLRDGAWSDVGRWATALGALATSRVEVTPLTDQEATDLSEVRPGLAPLLFGAPAVQEISRRPFFLDVLATAIGDGGDPIPSSEAELLSAWWRGGGYDAEGAVRARRQEVLLALASASAANLGRDAPVRGLDHDAIESLKADDILKDAEPGHTVSFRHDIFFEWAFTHRLVSAGADWLQAVVEAGEPPALGRPVELLSQLRFDADRAWAAQLDRLEAAHSRSQWRRSWMMAPLSSPRFEERASTFTAAFFVLGDSSRLRQLLTWFQAVRTRPGKGLDGLPPYDALSSTDRIRLADMMAEPADYRAWRRLLDWLLAQQGQVPVSLWPTVLTLAEIWQSALTRIPNTTTEGLVALEEHWLLALEAHQNPTEPRTLPGRFGGMDHNAQDQFADRLRTQIFRAALAYPDPTIRYLRALDGSRRGGRHVWRSVMESAAWVAKAAPALLVDAFLAEMLETLPKEKLRLELESDRQRRDEALKHPAGSRERSLLMPSFLGGMVDHHDWDKLSLDRRADLFYPPSPQTEPFNALFRHAPGEALRLVKSIADHAVSSWLELHDLDPEDGGTPVPLVLAFPWGLETFWGGEREYVAFRAAFAPPMLEAALMALEDWAFREQEGGRDVDEILSDVLKGTRHNAFLGIAAALAVTTNRASATTLPLISSQRLWNWDVRRLVKIDHDSSFNILGSRPGTPAAIALQRANQRPCRKTDIRQIAILFALSSDDTLRRPFLAAASTFSAEGGLDLEEERQDDALMDDRRRTAEIWARMGDPAHYRMREAEDGIEIAFEPPPIEDETVIEQEAARGSMFRWMRLETWAADRMGVRPAGPDMTLDEAISEARALDAPDLFEVRWETGSLEEIRRAGVAGVAAAVLADDAFEAAEVLAWAADVTFRAAATPLPNDGMTVPETTLSFHPLNYVPAALAGMIRRDLDQPAALRDLLGLVTHPLIEASASAAGEIYALGDHHPALAKAALCLALSLSIRSDLSRRYWGDRDGARAVRQQALQAATVHAFAVAFEDAEPTLPVLPIPLASEDAEDEDWGDEGEEALTSETMLDTGFLSAHLPPLLILGRTPEGAAILRPVALNLLAWTVAKLRTLSRGDRDASRLHRWRFDVMNWMARVAAGDPDIDPVGDIVAPAAALNDAPFCALMMPFVSVVVGNRVCDAKTLDPRAIEIMSAVATRLAGLTKTRRGDLPDEAHLLIQDLLCIGVTDAPASRRFANGDWRDLPMVLPVSTTLFDGLAELPGFVAIWLRFVEAARTTYPIDLFADQLTEAFARESPRNPLSAAGLHPRIGSLIQFIIDRDEAPAPETQDKLLRILDVLVDAGDRRAASLQQSESFRGRRRAAEGAAS